MGTSCRVWITWALVRMVPRSSMMVPEPEHVGSSPSNKTTCTVDRASSATVALITTSGSSTTSARRRRWQGGNRNSGRDRGFVVASETEHQVRAESGHGGNENADHGDEWPPATAARGVLGRVRAHRERRVWRPRAGADRRWGRCPERWGCGGRRMSDRRRRGSSVGGGVGTARRRVGTVGSGVVPAGGVRRYRSSRRRRRLGWATRVKRSVRLVTRRIAHRDRLGRSRRWSERCNSQRRRQHVDSERS